MKEKSMKNGARGAGTSAAMTQVSAGILVGKWLFPNPGNKRPKQEVQDPECTLSYSWLIFGPVL